MIAKHHVTGVVAKFPYDAPELVNAVDFGPDRHSQRRHRTHSGQQVRQVGGSTEIEEEVG